MIKHKTLALVTLLGTVSIPAMAIDLGNANAQFQNGVLTADKQIGGKSADLIHRPNGFTDLNVQGQRGSGELFVNKNGGARVAKSMGDKSVKVIRSPDGVVTLKTKDGNEARTTVLTPSAEGQALNGAVTDKAQELHKVAHNRLGMFAEGSSFSTINVK